MRESGSALPKVGEGVTGRAVALRGKPALAAEGGRIAGLGELRPEPAHRTSQRLLRT